MTLELTRHLEWRAVESQRLLRATERTGTARPGDDFPLQRPPNAHHYACDKGDWRYGEVHNGNR